MSTFPKKTNIRQPENNQKPSCPLCGCTLKPGYSTQIGRVLVCENYPRCAYIVRKEGKEDL
jgi:ssDNA-binding Zn-finger/Zn-ribbon topoisomerase 1